MDERDRTAIEGLFERLAAAEPRAPARDPEAEALIARAVAATPGAEYRMAQTIVAQQAALEAAQSRVEALETRGGGGGFLDSIFGAHPLPAPRRAAAPQSGASFLGGAAQTAMGVAGGLLLAEALATAFSGGADEQEPEDGDFDLDL